MTQYSIVWDGSVLKAENILFYWPMLIAPFLYSAVFHFSFLDELALWVLDLWTDIDCGSWVCGLIGLWVLGLELIGLWVLGLWTDRVVGPGPVD